MVVAIGSLADLNNWDGTGSAVLTTDLIFYGTSFNNYTPPTVSGTFDGAGHTLTFKNAPYGFTGLFRLNGGTIQNFLVTSELAVNFAYSFIVTSGVLISGAGNIYNVGIDIKNGTINTGAFLSSSYSLSASSTLNFQNCYYFGNIGTSGSGFISNASLTGASTINFDQCYVYSQNIAGNISFTNGGFMSNINTVNTVFNFTQCISQLSLNSDTYRSCAFIGSSFYSVASFENCYSYLTNTNYNISPAWVNVILGSLTAPLNLQFNNCYNYSADGSASLYFIASGTDFSGRFSNSLTNCVVPENQNFSSPSGLANLTNCYQLAINSPLDVAPYDVWSSSVWNHVGDAGYTKPPTLKAFEDNWSGYTSYLDVPYLFGTPSLTQLGWKTDSLFQDAPFNVDPAVRNQIWIEFNPTDCLNLSSYLVGKSVGDNVGFYNAFNNSTSIVQGFVYIAQLSPSIIFKTSPFNISVGAHAIINKIYLNFAYSSAAYTQANSYISNGIFGGSSYNLVFKYNIDIYHATDTDGGLDDYVITCNSATISSLPAWNQVMTTFYRTMTHYVMPYVISTDNTAILNNSLYTKVFSDFTASYQNTYVGISNSSILKGASLPDTLVNETTINSSFNALTEGDGLASSFTQGSQTYLPPITPYSFLSDTAIQASGPIFSTSQFTTFSTGSSVNYLNIYFCQKNSAMNHLIMYTDVNQQQDYATFWTVITPINNYASISANGYSGVYYQYQIPITEGHSYNFAFVPEGNVLIPSCNTAVTTTISTGVNMIANPSDTTYYNGAINISYPTPIPFFSLDTDVNQSYNDSISSTWWAGYQPNTTHLLNACYTRTLTDTNSYLGASFIFMEDLQLNQNTGFAEGYSDTDFNDLTMLLVPQGVIDSPVALTLFS